MMVEPSIILERYDVIESSAHKTLSELTLSDFNVHPDTYQLYAVILFVDNDCSTRIIKNRYGNKGGKE